MANVIHACSICQGEADWMRTRMPNKDQMSYLCHRHYQSLQQRNALLASYYDAIAAQPPMSMQPDPAENAQRKNNSD